MRVNGLPPAPGGAGESRWAGSDGARKGRHRGLAGALVALWLLGTPQPVPAQQPPPPPAAPRPVATTPQQQALTQAQLEQLLAPIALYPDDLLMQVLMASTYPLEVVQAKRWLGQGQNASLRGDALSQALAAQPWDPSVKSLLPFPDVLTMMNDQLDWTQQLGDAVLAQQQDVMNAVQVLRGRAQAAGMLQSGPQQTVNVTPAPPPPPGASPPAVVPPPQVITIAPAQPEVVYVPAYDPNVVYGTWPYPASPPYYYPPPAGWGVGNALLTGMAFAAGAAVVGSLWGWASPGWGRGNIDVNVNRYNNINVNRRQIDSNVWQHDVSHRHGVAYSNDSVRNQVGANRPGVDGVDRGQARDQLRGRMDQGGRGGGPGAAGPGGARPGLGAQRPGGDGAPGLGAGRPGGPGGGAGRPGGDGAGAARPDGGARPGGARPGGARPGGARPGAGAGAGDGSRPARPGAARPGDGSGIGGGRPGGGAAPAQRPAGGTARPAPARQPQGFQGVGNGGRDRAAAQRGAASRQGMQRPSGGRSGGGGRRR